MDEIPVQKLHSRFTRGEVLTEEERSQLNAWYERQDRAEAAMLAASASSPLATLNDLRGELATALTRLREETQRIQAQTDGNEVLRRENAVLSERLARSGSRQAA